MTVPVSDLQAIAPSSIIELFELELNTLQHGVNETWRFHAGSSLNDNGEVTWAGNAYLRFPVEAEGFEYSGNGQLPRPKIRVSNILGTITAILLGLPSGLEGAKVTRIRTLARYLDAVNFPGSVNPYGTPDPTAEFPREIYYIDRKTAETRDVVEFELAAAFDLAGVRAPKRQCVANICQWEYRSTECGYTGNAYFDANDQPVSTAGEDVCGKRLSSCELRFAQLSRAGSVTAGSNQLVLDSALAVNTGAPIKGFAVPAGTTAVSYSGNTITMSANATATTSLTKTGTLQSNLTQIVLSNVTGLTPGMVVSGPKIGAGTTITAIAGNTITLGQAVDITLVLQVAASGSARILTSSLSYVSAPSSTLIIQNLSLLNAISVGMWVTGFGLPAANPAKVISKSSIFSQPYTATLSYSAVGQSTFSTYTFYTQATQSSQTYTFTAASRNYIFRQNGILNFGSFPGIGTYSS